jgi:hypothetical protein
MNYLRITSTISLAAAALAGSVYFSPYWNLHQLRSAIEGKDAESVSDRVDFPQLRDSIKSQMLVMLEEERHKKENASPFEALGQAMALALINPLIDATVSPAGVATMIQHGKFSLEPAGGNKAGDQVQGDKVDYAMSYQGWSQFAVAAKGQDSGAFIFKRYGLWQWKLAAIELPRNGKTKPQ